MSNLLETPHRAQLDSLARQTGFSADAVATMLDAMIAGGGRMAQFDHPEFGGSGQWMHGGMLMIGDFSDHALRARVARLCDALAQWLADEPALASEAGEVAHERSYQRQSQTSGGVAHVQDSRDPTGRWWPASFGTPDTSGAQDGSRYAWFAGARRLVVDDGRTRTIYDTGEHRIGGASQQQGSSTGARGPVFTSQFGPVDVDRLPVVGADDDDRPASRVDEPRASQAALSPDDSFTALERLADLHRRGIVDDGEFAAKKAELLKRI